MKVFLPRRSAAGRPVRTKRVTKPSDNQGAVVSLAAHDPRFLVAVAECSFVAAENPREHTLGYLLHGRNATELSRYVLSDGEVGVARRRVRFLDGAIDTIRHQKHKQPTGIDGLPLSNVRLCNDRFTTSAPVRKNEMVTTPRKVFVASKWMNEQLLLFSLCNVLLCLGFRIIQIAARRKKITILAKFERSAHGLLLGHID